MSDNKWVPEARPNVDSKYRIHRVAHACSLHRRVRSRRGMAVEEYFQAEGTVWVHIRSSQDAGCMGIEELEKDDDTACAEGDRDARRASQRHCPRQDHIERELRLALCICSAVSQLITRVDPGIIESGIQWATG